jgi:hypothetical protein
VRQALTLSAVSALWVVALVACSPASVEEQTLLRFFVAARTLDSTVIQKYATIGFNPRTEGIVQSFTMRTMSPEQQGRKDATIDAVVREPDGAKVRRTLVATFQKIEGRWMITGLQRTPASQTSREASSAPPN